MEVLAPPNPQIVFTHFYRQLKGNLVTEDKGHKLPRIRLCFTQIPKKIRVLAINGDEGLILKRTKELFCACKVACK
jgi:hypothetical protein